MQPPRHHQQTKSNPSFSLRPFCASIRLIWFTLCLLSVLLSVPLLNAAPNVTTSQADFSDHLDIPLEYGEVIYRFNPGSNKQVYIIGIRHRDPKKGSNDHTTVQTQKEIYRIGEWLKRKNQIDLLLPEGYFNANNLCSINSRGPGSLITKANRDDITSDILEQELTSTTFKNAEMLLMEHLSFSACQVENRTLYSAVRNSLQKLYNSDTTSSASTIAIEEIRSLQELRTAHLLQTIPTIIEKQYDDGTIGNRSAIFTIGLNHLKHIFRYIENGTIDIASSFAPQEKHALVNTNLNLLKAGYGVSIIIPRILAEDVHLLEITQIDRILLADRR